MAQAPAYSDAAGYRERVIDAITRKELPKVFEGLAPVSPLRFHHLGVICRDVAASIAFYNRLGFERASGDAAAARGGAGIIRLAHTNGLELHLVQSDAPAEAAEPTNILMDTPALKYPGHTHCAWTVPSISGVKVFLDAAGVPLSGTRSTLAVFVRDVDRTTLEFERK